MIENTSFTGESMNGGGDEASPFEDVTEEEIAAAIQKGGQARVHRGRRSRPHAHSHKISSPGIEQMASRRSRRSTRRASRKASRKGRRATRKH